MDIVGKFHGMPRSLISDRDPLFMSHFWQDLFRLSGTTLRMSSAYHPQTDGQTEVLNRVIEQCLRAFMHQKPSSREKFLNWVEWSYNTSIHSGSGLSPYELTFGKKPLSIPQYLTSTSKLDAVDDILKTREEAFSVMRKKLIKAQDLMKKMADKDRRDVTFAEGDWVMVKLHPHKQSSVSGTYSKLTKRFYGPYQIVEHMGKAAYKLQLPEDARIHLVFHCSLLKPFHHSTAEHIDYSFGDFGYVQRHGHRRPGIGAVGGLSTRRDHVGRLDAIEGHRPP